MIQSEPTMAQPSRIQWKPLQTHPQHWQSLPSKTHNEADGSTEGSEDEQSDNGESVQGTVQPKIPSGIIDRVPTLSEPSTCTSYPEAAQPSTRSMEATRRAGKGTLSLGTQSITSSSASTGMEAPSTDKKRRSASLAIRKKQPKDNSGRRSSDALKNAVDRKKSPNHDLESNPKPEQHRPSGTLTKKRRLEGDDVPGQKDTRSAKRTSSQG